MAVINMPIDDEMVDDDRNVMSEINYGGDVKHRWDPSNAHEVAAVRASFDQLKAQGYTAYRLEGPKGARTQAGVMREFDPTAERLVMVPAMVPG